MVDQAHKPTEDPPWQLHKYYYAIDKVAQTDLCNNQDKSNVVEHEIAN